MHFISRKHTVIEKIDVGIIITDNYRTIHFLFKYIVVLKSNELMVQLLVMFVSSRSCILNQRNLYRFDVSCYLLLTKSRSDAAMIKLMQELVRIDTVTKY